MLGIIGAMEEEVFLLKEQLSKRSGQTIGGVEFYSGFLNGKFVVLCKTGVGKVHAAYAASVLILHFGVKSLIFIGVAGAAHPSLKFGDMVLALDCLYHDMDARAMGWKISEIPDGSPSVFPCDYRITEALYKIAVTIYGAASVYKGRIVSGDQFIADSEKIKDLRHLFNAYAVDMESAAVAHIALKHNIPCGIVRSISDKADDGASKDYSNNLSEVAQRSALLVSESVKSL